MDRGWSLLAVALLALAATAGCLGGDDAAPNEAGASGGDGSDQEQAEAPEPPESNTSATYEERTDSVEGAITGAGADGCTANIFPLSDQPAEFEVPKEAVRTNLTLSLEGTGDACAAIFAPSQQVGSDQAAGNASTASGDATWTAKDPEAGTWTVYLYGDGVGPTDGTYVLDLVHRVKVSGAGAS